MSDVDSSPERYPSDLAVDVYPFTRQQSGDEVVIGRPDTGVFLALPPEAVELLDLLAEGLEVGAAQRAFEQRHGEMPDMEDFLVSLESRGLVQPANGAPFDVSREEAPGKPQATTRFHLVSLSENLAKKIFSGPALLLGAVVVAGALLAMIADPELVPSRRSLVFTDSSSIKLALLALMTYVGVGLHELGHVVAAKAVGTPARIGIGHRMWMLVAEADLTALWSVPREKRYFPLLAGPLVDLVSGSLVILVLWGARHGYYHLPDPAIDLLQAWTFVYLLALIFQCFFFVRTDFYYVFANRFNCKNLMGDTVAWLRRQARRWLPESRSLEDQPLQIPAGELRVVQGYAVFWVVGRLVALAFLFLVTLPVLIEYLVLIGNVLDPRAPVTTYQRLDAFITGLVVTGPLCVGITLWMRSLYSSWRHGDARATSA